MWSPPEPKNWWTATGSRSERPKQEGIAEFDAVTDGRNAGEAGALLLGRQDLLLLGLQFFFVLRDDGFGRADDGTALDLTKISERLAFPEVGKEQRLPRFQPPFPDPRQPSSPLRFCHRERGSLAGTYRGATHGTVCP